MLSRTIVIASFSVFFQIHAISALSIATRGQESVIDVKVDGENLKCDPLPQSIFAQNSARTSMCYLVEPFKGARGILKSVEKQGIPEVLGLEADYTKMVDQYIYHSFDDDKYFFRLIVKDPRTGFLNPSRNATTAPERKFFHDWYLTDTNMDLTKSLDKLRKSMHEQAIYHAEKHGLLFQNLHILNAYTDEALHDTVFPDWAPMSSLKNYGVVPLPQDPTKKKERMERFKEDLDYILPRSIGIHNLKMTLDDYGQTLRAADKLAWEAAWKSAEGKAAQKEQAKPDSGHYDADGEDNSD